MEYFIWYYTIGAIISFLLFVKFTIDDKGFANVGDTLTCFVLASVPVLRECLIIYAYGETVINTVVFTKGENK